MTIAGWQTGWRYTAVFVNATVYRTVTSRTVYTGIPCNTSAITIATSCLPQTFRGLAWPYVLYSPRRVAIKTVIAIRSCVHHPRFTASVVSQSSLLLKPKKTRTVYKVRVQTLSRCCASTDSWRLKGLDCVVYLGELVFVLAMVDLRYFTSSFFPNTISPPSLRRYSVNFAIRGITFIVSSKFCYVPAKRN